jgi:hypothetical protein
MKLAAKSTQLTAKSTQLAAVSAGTAYVRCCGLTPADRPVSVFTRPFVQGWLDGLCFVAVQKRERECGDG